ncbi:hypothetical protein VNO78_32853 [Psophocarpus tetragonolobus]|uniref:Uncharacterized protein n=1 Tax=Psophocarpus tetragonolobus TaxID=3891 RepID=A0AAN9RKV0_PSOTE
MEGGVKCDRGELRQSNGPNKHYLLEQKETAIIFTNFPITFNAKDMWNIFQLYGKVTKTKSALVAKKLGLTFPNTQDQWDMRRSQPMTNREGQTTLRKRNSSLNSFSNNSDEITSSFLLESGHDYDETVGNNLED